MLGVTFTSRSALEEGDSRRKKDKKDKKKKKEKRDRKEKRDKKGKRAGSGSEDSSSGDENGLRAPGCAVSEEGPVKAPDAANDQQDVTAEPPPQREDWMTKPMRREVPKPSGDELQEQGRKQAPPAEPEVVAGLRIMKKPDSGTTGAAGGAGSGGSGLTAAGGGGGGGGAHGARAGGGGGGLVGDGGASWRLKALRRAQEQARAEGRNLQEVVGERWGSLAQLTQDLSTTAAAEGKAHLRAAAERRRAAAEGVPAVVPHYLQDVRSERGKMLRPSDQDSLSWRSWGGTGARGGPAGREDRPAARRGGDEDEDRRTDGRREAAAPAPGGHDARGGRDSRSPGRDRDRDRTDDLERQHERERRDGRDQRDVREAERGRGREAGEGERGRDRSRDAERDRGQERGAGGEGGERDQDRGRDRDRGADEQRERGRDDRQRHREREYDREYDRERDPERWRGGRDSRDRGGGGGSRPSREQAAALQQLAGSLNAFRDDGSFMDRFLAAQERQKQPQQQPKAQQESSNGGDRAANHCGGGTAADGDVRQGVTRVKLEPRAEPGPGSRTGRVRGGDEDGVRDGKEDGADEPGPAPAGAAAPAAGSTGTAGMGGGGGGNRAIAAMLRGRAGVGGGSRGGDGDGGGGGGGGGGAGREQATASAAAAAVEAAAPRRAPLFVTDAGAVGDGGGGGSAAPSAGGGGGGGGGNKSAAELLQARLKGLPPPAAAADDGSGRPGIKEEEGDDDGAGPGPSSARGGGGETSHGGRGGGREVVHLPLVDSQGRAVRGAFGREAAGAGAAPNAGRRVGTKPPERYNRETGEKERYFADDDKVDLQTMLRRAKYGDDDMDMDRHLAANIAKKRKFRGTDLDVDAEYDFDGGVELYESRSKRGNAEVQRNRDRSRQVADLRRQQAAEAGCMLCLSNPKRPQHLAIALGTCAYLCLPYRGRLVKGHCCIAPAEHLPSIRGLDEATWTEVKNFIKCLIRMYGAQGQAVLFMETYIMTRSGGRHHAVLDAIPVTERQLEKARGYFKKAILEAESEWSTHHAKACIETTAQKGLRESIPPNFPYFYVQFGYGAGYVHVIDDETKFDPNFGRQVLIGLLDLPPEMAYQRQKAESMATQQQWVREFEAQWDPYDWTRQLDAAA